MLTSYIEKAFGKSNVEKIKHVFEKDHYRLGDDMHAKMLTFFPELNEESEFLNKRLLLCVLHSQQEVVFQLEDCRKILVELVNGENKSVEFLKDELYRLRHELDMMKMEIIFLVGELNEEEGHTSYYVLDGFLRVNSLSFDDIEREGGEIMKSYSLRKGRGKREYERYFEGIKRRLEEVGADREVVEVGFELISEMLSSGYDYCEWLRRFIEAEGSATLVYSRFKRVVAEGMRLLFYVMLSEMALEMIIAQFYIQTASCESVGGEE